MTSTSIRARLLASVAAIQIVAAGLATYLVVEHERRQSYVVFDARLGEQAAVLHSLVEAPEDEAASFIFHREFMALPEGNRFSISDSTGRRIDSSKNWPELKSTSVQPRTLVNIEVQGVQYRALVVQKLAVVDSEPGHTSQSPTLSVVYASPVAPVEAHIRRVELQSVLACAALLCLSTLVSAWALSRGLRPVRDLAARAEAIDVGNWNVSELGRSRQFSELKPLADALTGLVDRLHSAFDRERHFFADAAHEMKSSIAIVRSTLQLALQSDRTATEYRVELNAALEDTDRLQGLVGSMFNLARIESNNTTATGVTNITAAATEVHAQARLVMERLRPLASRRGVGIELEGFGREVWVRMPEEDFATMLSNLIENAILYSDPAKVVVVGVAAEGDICTLSVTDKGCGIAEAALPHIYDRFYRADASRTRATGGVGLGLSIVRALVLRAGGTISVQSEPGKGSIFTMVLALEKSVPA